MGYGGFRLHEVTYVRPFLHHCRARYDNSENRFGIHKFEALLPPEIEKGLRPSKQP